MSSNTEIMKVFGALLAAEQREQEAIARLKIIEGKEKHAIAEAKYAQEKAWEQIKAIMEETGEYEITLSGAATDYKISYSTPRESVKVADAMAVPDEWVKIERKPKLKEIGDHLKELREVGAPFPNWASLEKGESSLFWKAVKKVSVYA